MFALSVAPLAAGETELGASLLVMSIVGGGVITPITGALSDALSIRAALALLPTAGFAAVGAFAAWHVAGAGGDGSLLRGQGGGHETEVVAPAVAADEKGGRARWEGRFPRTVHLGGGAWATAFTIGAVRALEERWEAHRGAHGLSGSLHEHVAFSGDSAGAAMAAGVALGMGWRELRELYLRLARRARAEGVWGGRMSGYHEEMLDALLASPAHLQALQARA